MPSGPFGKPMGGWVDGVLWLRGIGEWVNLYLFIFATYTLQYIIASTIHVL